MNLKFLACYLSCDPARGYSGQPVPVSWGEDQFGSLSVTKDISVTINQRRMIKTEEKAKVVARLI